MLKPFVYVFEEIDFNYFELSIDFFVKLLEEDAFIRFYIANYILYPMEENTTNKDEKIVSKKEMKKEIINYFIEAQSLRILVYILDDENLSHDNYIDLKNTLNELLRNKFFQPSAYFGMYLENVYNYLDVVYSTKNEDELCFFQVNVLNNTNENFYKQILYNTKEELSDNNFFEYIDYNTQFFDYIEFEKIESVVSRGIINTIINNLVESFLNSTLINNVLKTDNIEKSKYKTDEKIERIKKKVLSGGASFKVVYEEKVTDIVKEEYYFKYFTEGLVTAIFIYSFMDLLGEQKLSSTKRKNKFLKDIVDDELVCKYNIAPTYEILRELVKKRNIKKLIIPTVLSHCLCTTFEEAFEFSKKLGIYKEEVLRKRRNNKLDARLNIFYNNFNKIKISIYPNYKFLSNTSFLNQEKD